MLETLQQKEPLSEFVDVAERNRKNQDHGATRTDRRLSHDEEFAAAQEEWEAVQCVEPILRSPHKDNYHKSPKKYIDSSSSSPAKTPSKPPPVLPPTVRVTPHTDFDEVWDYFMRQDMSHVMGSIKPTLEQRGFNGLFRTLFGPKKLKAELVDERNLLFAIAQCQFDNSEPIHLQILQTVYKVLTGTKIDCPRYGSHWDVIGFQGVDPATDLRGVGLLGLVQALYLLTHESLLPLARDVFRLSHDQHSQFPLMVLSINVTRISLQTLREGYLNKECNSRGNVRHVLNQFFTAVLFHIFWIWKTESKTIKDSGFIIKDAEAYCKRNVKTVLQKLQVQLRKYSHAEEGQLV
ncbi:ELMO domain-containing protein 3-like [Portunus trituberculatus]|uniref:ELMO domain-containing protein 3-like n=1 Tax=Portunus trituberculatus TaxID=210409 RepID=UPI001E1D06DE|nr:ELMO domain-containing protein 3-like [Portunus trituberculatus]